MTNKVADIDEFLYSCGIEILHPGGLEKADEMVKMYKIGKGKRFGILVVARV